MRLNVRKVFFGLPFLIFSGLFIAYLLFGYFAVNLLVQRIVPWMAETRLDSRASVGQVKFDPLRLTVDVDNFRLSEPDDALLAGFKHLHLHLEAGGLFRFAWQLGDVEVVAPAVRFDIAPGGTLNWGRLIAALNKNRTPPSKTLPRVLIKHLKIVQGDIEYIDRNRPASFVVSLLPLDLQLDGLSTLPADRGNYLIAAKLPRQGGTLKWDGKIGLNPVVSSGRVALEGVKLAELVRAVKQAELPLTPTAGVIDTRLAYRFSMVKDQPRVMLTHIALGLKNFAATAAGGASGLTAQQLFVQAPRVDLATRSGTTLRFKDLTAQLTAMHLKQSGKPLFDLAQARASGVDFDLATRRVQIARMTFTGGDIHASRSADGVIDWQRAMVPGAPSSASPAPPAAPSIPPPRPFVFDIAAVELRNWQAHYIDRGFRYPLSVDASNFNSDFALSNASGALRLSGLNSAAGPITLLSARSNKPAATLRQLRIENGELDLAKRAVTLRAIVASGLRSDIIKQSGKGLALQAAFQPLKPAAKTNPALNSTVRRPIRTAKPAAWTLALQRAALENAALHFEDRAKGKTVALDIVQANLAAHDLSLDLRKPIPVAAHFKVEQGGSFDARGTIVPAPLSGVLKLKLSALSLKPFAPYINRIARLKLNSGSASSTGTLTLRQGKKPALDYAGGFAVDKLGITEEEGGARFLSWQRLSSDDLTLKLAPSSLHIGTLRAVKPVGKIIIFPDKTLNLTRLLRSEAPPPAAAGSAPPVAAPNATASVAISRSASARDTFPISIERIRIDNAGLEFADLSLTPQFGTDIHSLSGVINGLSSNPATVSQVELDGIVERYGSASIRGSLQPFHATDFTDLTLSFRNLEMNRLTPYSGKFAGRKILSGRLSVDLEYKIRNRQLLGENQFIMNKLRLGEHVDSPYATHLPLDLAIALLQDSNGVINLNLPVSGNLDDPQFSYGRILWKAFVNVLTKLASAPFRVLGHLLGVSPDKLEVVSFDAGSAKLLPPEQEKLKSVAQAMGKRPALALTVEPVYAGSADARAIERQSIRREVTKTMGLKLAPGEKPGPIDLTNPKAQKAVLTLAEARLKHDQFKQVKAGYGKPEANGSALYAALLEQLMLQIPVADDELQRLAQQRGDVIRQALLADGVAPDHLSVAAPVAGSATDQTVNTKLSLGVSRTAMPPAAPAVGQPRPAE
ncbi:MAG TPA: DUF748 domain-containing protein [Burkholderiales bacterium]|nr:DUF748 domain-containing protein [Burkholderiales bacterium]